ncbi:hypothetical protein Tco_1314095 [Tanacetum coccineum]
MNGWVEEEDPEMEEEEEDPEEDLEMEEEEEEMDAREAMMNNETAQNGYFLIRGRTHFTLRHLHLTLRLRLRMMHLCEAEADAEPLIPLKRLFTDTQVWTGSSSSAAAAGHNPEDLTPSHIRSDLDALDIAGFSILRRMRLRADNKRLKMMLDCSENRTRDAWIRARFGYVHYLSLEHGLFTLRIYYHPRLQYQEPPYALLETLLAPVTHNDPRVPYVAL